MSDVEDRESTIGTDESQHVSIQRGSEDRRESVTTNVQVCDDLVHVHSEDVEDTNDFPKKNQGYSNKDCGPTKSDESSQNSLIVSKNKNNLVTNEHNTNIFKKISDPIKIIFENDVSSCHIPSDVLEPFAPGEFHVFFSVIVKQGLSSNEFYEVGSNHALVKRLDLMEKLNTPF